MKYAAVSGFVSIMCAVLSVFFSCSPALSVSLDPDGKLECSFEAKIPDSIADTVRSFGDVPAGMPLFDASQLTAALKRAGFIDVKAVSPFDTAVNIKAAVNSAAELLPQIPGVIVYKTSSGTVPASFTVVLSPDVMAQILALLPAETMDYIDLLSAPVFTGEQMSAGEYIDLIGAVYGKTAAGELQRGVLTVSVRVPDRIISAVSSVKSSSIIKKEKSVDFTIPLAEFLTQSEKIEFCVQF